MNTTPFDDFARHWLLGRKDMLADAMIDIILQAPMRMVPPKLRKLAANLRWLRTEATQKRRLKPVRRT